MSSASIILEIVHTAQYRNGDLNGAIYMGAAILGGGHDNHIESFAHTFGEELNEK